MTGLAIGRTGLATGRTQFPASYRRICQDLNLARSSGFSSATVESLNRMVWEGHQNIYKKPSALRLSLGHSVFVEFPRAVRRHIVAFAAGCILFYGFGFFALLFCMVNPGGPALIMGQEGVDRLTEMYDPTAEHFLKPRDVTGSADMFGYYINNNIGIGFRTFAGGAFAGVGSMFFVIFNGIQMGAAAAAMIGQGFTDSFFGFVVTHAAFELTAIVLFGMAGLKLGWAFISPGRLRRGDSFRLQAKECLPILYGSTFFLVIAAGIEAFWSSLAILSSYKFIAGAACWALVGLFLALGGRSRG